tara:strand:+ start:219870 stop:220286 length:417 start_codon:yes stop_codon:yes gene_type:complete
MPATFESYGIKFLYPDNWTVLDRDDDDSGSTLELPSGGFLSIDQVDASRDADSFIDEVADTLKSEYDELEREWVDLQGAGEHETAADMRFYYLDLVIVARVIVMPTESGPLLIQFQAESRDFDANEKVLDAILLQIRK